MLKTKIELDFIEAFKHRDTLKKNTLGILKTAMSNWATDKKNAGKEISDADIINILSSEVKKRKQTLELYADAAVKDAAMLENIANEEKELAILMEYLPPQMTEEEMLTEINNLKKGLVSTDKLIPVVMGHFNKLFKGQFDNKKLQELLNK